MSRYVCVYVTVPTTSTAVAVTHTWWLLQACVKKTAALQVPCPFCDQEQARGDLDNHIKHCAVRRNKKIPLPARLQKRKGHHGSNGHAHSPGIGDHMAGGAGGAAGAFAGRCVVCTTCCRFVCLLCVI